MIIYIICMAMTLVALVLSYLVYNLNKKISIYEEAVQNFYEQVSIIIHIMRSIDNRKMFESDDEVGYIFEGLSEAVNMLSPLIYGVPDGEEEN